LKQIPTGDIVTTNICFGGADRKTATITLAGKGEVIEMEWDRPGLALAYG
jgi:gluconolactonase